MVRDLFKAVIGGFLAGGICFILSPWLYAICEYWFLLAMAFGVVIGESIDRGSIWFIALIGTVLAGGKWYLVSFCAGGALLFACGLITQDENSLFNLKTALAAFGMIAAKLLYMCF